MSLRAVAQQKGGLQCQKRDCKTKAAPRERYCELHLKKAPARDPIK